MHNVEPKVYLIYKSTGKYENIEEWLKDIGTSENTRINYTGNGFDGPDHKTEGETLVELAGRRCYMSFEVGLNPNITKIRENVKDYIDNILKVGHGSVLEHVSFTFAIENVSRVLTGELNRHRAGTAISEGSMRYIRFDDIPFWIPTSLQLNEEESKLLDTYFEKIFEDGLLDEIKESLSIKDRINLEIALKKETSQKLFQKAFKQMEDNYKEFCRIWKDELSETSTFTTKKHLTSCGRRIIGMGVATGGLWTGNIRALRNIFEMRCSSVAEEEILLVASKMLEIMMKEEPILFGDFGKDEKGFYKPSHHKV